MTDFRVGAFFALPLLSVISPETRSFKIAIYGTFARRMRKDVKYFFDKNHDERAWYRN